MVDMGDDGDISNFLRIKHGKRSLRVAQMVDFALVPKIELTKAILMLILYLTSFCLIN